MLSDPAFELEKPTGAKQAPNFTRRARWPPKCSFSS
jgi:hypothetical protein